MNTWDTCDVVAQARIIAYDQIRRVEDAELEAEKLKALLSSR